MKKKFGAIFGAVVLLGTVAACLICFRSGVRHGEAQALAYSQGSLTSRCSQQLEEARSEFDKWITFQDERYYWAGVDAYGNFYTIYNWLCVLHDNSTLVAPLRTYAQMNQMLLVAPDNCRAHMKELLVALAEVEKDPLDLNAEKDMRQLYYTISDEVEEGTP